MNCKISKTLFIAVAAMGVSAHGMLPMDYKGLEYIESTGSSYLDTGIVPTETTKVFFDFMPTSKDGQTAFFGQAWAGSAYLLANITGSFYWFGPGKLFASFVKDQRYQLTVETGRIVLTENGVETPYTSSISTTCTANKHLFVSAVEGGNNKCKQRIYEMKIGCSAKSGTGFRARFAM